jgi:hemerythrin
MTNATSAFRWTERYSVHIAALDRQHQRLFDTINELNDALATGEGSTVADPVLKKLVDYALYHFAAEEALMTEHNFPGVFTHRMEHGKFAQSVTKLLDGYRAGKPGVPVSLLLFLQTWLKEHILVTDKAYSDFLNARGIR